MSDRYYAIKFTDDTSTIVHLDKITKIVSEPNSHGDGYPVSLLVLTTDGKPLKFDCTKEAAEKHIAALTNSKTEKPKMKSVISDFSGFIKEHRSVLYWVAVLMLVDHFVFAGAFRVRLQNIVEGIVSKVESKAKEIK